MKFPQNFRGPFFGHHCRPRRIAIGRTGEAFQVSFACRADRCRVWRGQNLYGLGLAHVLKAKTILVMCPSHLGKKWAREAIQTIPFVRTFLIEDMRNGGDPSSRTEFPRCVCARAGSFRRYPVLLAELAHGSERLDVPLPAVLRVHHPEGQREALVFLAPRLYLTAKCGPELGGVINPDTGPSIENPTGSDVHGSTSIS